MDGTPGDTVVLSGSNAYGGGTIVQSGILSIENGSALGSGSVDVWNNATLQLGGGILVSTIAQTTLTLAGTGDGGIGALCSVSGNNEWCGQILLDGSALLDSGASGDVLTLTPPVGGTVINGSGGSSLTFGGSGNVVVGGQAGDEGIGPGVAGVTMDGSACWQLELPDDYGIGTTVESGTLGIITGAAIPTGTSLTVASGGTWVFDPGFTVDPTVSSIYVGNDATLDLGGEEVVTSGTVTLADGSIIDGTITSTADAYSLQSGTISAVLAGNVGLMKSGSGVVVLTSHNTYTGRTTISQGTLQLGDGTRSATTARSPPAALPTAGPWSTTLVRYGL